MRISDDPCFRLKSRGCRLDTSYPLSLLQRPRVTCFSLIDNTFGNFTCLAMLRAPLYDSYYLHVDLAMKGLECLF